MRPAAWPEILDGEVRAAEGLPFAWGRHDCFTWAARVVRRLGGPDLMARAGVWHDEAGAQAAVQALGADLEAAVARICADLHMQEVPPALAQRGDLVVLRTPRGPTTAICTGRQAMAAAEAGGVIGLPMTLALRAWAV